MSNFCIFLLFSLPIADAAVEREREKESYMKVLYIFIGADVTILPLKDGENGLK